MVKQRKHDKEFKISICKLILEDKIPVSVVAREYSLAIPMVHRWVKEYKTHGSDGFVGRGHLRAEDARIKELEKENEELKMELEILKKTKKYFLQRQNKE